MLIIGYEEHTCTEEYFERHVVNNPDVICTKSKVAKLCGMDMKIYFHSHSMELLESLVVEKRQQQQQLKAHPHLEEQRDDCPHTLSEEEVFPAHTGIMEEEMEFVPTNKVNRGASLLTFDPRTGSCQYKILGKAYVVVDSGDYPLSDHQVFGLTELVSSVRDVYHCDPDHSQRGIEQLLCLCEDYRHRNYGPLTIYEPRVVVSPAYEPRHLGSQSPESGVEGGEADPWKEDSENLSTQTVVPEDHYRHRHHHHYYNHGRDQRDDTLDRVDPTHPVDLSCGDKYGQRARFRDDDVFHLLEPLEQPFSSPPPLQQQQQQHHNRRSSRKTKSSENHHNHDNPSKRRVPRIFGACNALA